MGLFEHISLGFCWWDIPAVILLIATIVCTMIRRRRLKDQVRELEYELAGKYVDDFIGFDEG